MSAKTEWTCGLNVFLGMIVAMLLEIFEALADKAGKEAHFDPGDCLFTQGQEMTSVFLLDAGEVKLVRALSQSKVPNREVILQRVQGPAILAEASLYAERYDCDAFCTSACRIRRLSAARFLSLVEESAVLSSAWAAHLAGSLQEARVRSEILTLKTARERLDAWLAWRGGELPEKEERQLLAAYLGVSLTTLRRELSRRS